MPDERDQEHRVPVIIVRGSTEACERSIRTAQLLGHDHVASIAPFPPSYLHVRDDKESPLIGTDPGQGQLSTAVGPLEARPPRTSGPFHIDLALDGG